MNSQNRKTIKIAAIALAALIIVAGIGVTLFFKQQADTDKLLSADEISRTQNAQNNPSEIVVHVAGAVNAPGLVRLKTDSEPRVANAIEAAGGATASADLDSLNLARVIADGEKITVPDKNALSSSGAGAADIININTATADQLQTLPGIGKVMADNIVAYREAHGGFSTVEQIKEVDRIGDKLFEKIKDKITV
ncbi:MAG: ComEA family DNA-binding protein [Eubacteriaceae bacterium]|nr:ComEA family DNA-binding protein [Eubacteriaceae bacterium]